MKTFKPGLLALVALIVCDPVSGTVIFTENAATPGSTTAVNSYTGWQNNGILSFTGTADVRTSTASTGYSGASGDGNIFLTNTGTSTFIISAIDVSAYTGFFDLSFGAYKSTTASNLSELTLAYSTNGSSYTNLTLPALATGAGTAKWYSIGLSSIALPVSSTLYLKWTNTSTTPQFRLDDIMLSGTLTAVPEPATYAQVLGLMVIITAVVRKRRSARHQKSLVLS